VAKLSTLVDNFSVDSIGTLWDDTSVSTGSALVTAGKLRTRCGAAAGQSGEVLSTNFYDADESGAYVRLIRDGNAEAVFRVEDVNVHGYRFNVGTGGNLLIARLVAGVGTLIVTVAYDPSTMAFLRYREAGGISFLERAAEVSGSPGSFTTIVSEPTNTNASYDHLAVKVRLRSTRDTISDVDQFWDGVNTSLEPVGAISEDAGWRPVAVPSSESVRFW